MRLATRLSLSYIGFLALLSILVLVLAGIQIGRLAKTTSRLPVPASTGDAVAIATALGREGLTTPIPNAFLKNTLGAGGWAQILDARGDEVQAVAAPADRRRAFSAAELAALTRATGGTGNWHYEIQPIKVGDEIRGVVILAAPSSAALGLRINSPMMRVFWSYFFTGVGMAVLAAVVLALGAGFWYARRLARPLVRLSRALEVAAAGDFSQRIPVEGDHEFSVLAGAYNHLVERLASAEVERARVEQARRDLVANISHDLRTPLTSIQGFTEAMAAEDAPPEVRRQDAATVAERIRALDAMLGDLLELSRLQALPAVRRAPGDLLELIREQVIALMPEAERAGLEVEVDLPEGLPPVALDARLIGRALQNLLVNAIRHNGGARHLAVSLMRSGSGVAITIADDGQGIPAADLPLLFERYYQGTSATNRKQGTGLGLAIVRQIAENHGGNVSVQTVVGRGTQFTLWLPLSG